MSSERDLRAIVLASNNQCWRFPLVDKTPEDLLEDLDTRTCPTVEWLVPLRDECCRLFLSLKAATPTFHHRPMQSSPLPLGCEENGKASW